MFETPLTVTGRIVTDPVRRRVGDQELVKFRLASNSRRRTAGGVWEPGNSLYLTVNCWGRLAAGVSGSLAKGDAVIASGYVYTSEYEDRDGNKRSSAELRATAVGPDLAWYLVKLERINQPQGTPAQEVAAEEADDDGEEAPLPLSA